MEALAALEAYARWILAAVIAMVAGAIFVIVRMKKLEDKLDREKKRWRDGWF